MSSEAEESGLPSRRSSTVRTFAFHKLSPRFSFGSTNFSPARFEQLLKSLRGEGWKFRSAIPAGGEAGTGVAFSFDDGYAHLAEVLPRLIELFGIEPLIFVPTAFIGRPNSWDYTHYFVKEPHLDRPAIRMLAEKGARFGSHSHQHVDLSGLPERRLAMELRQSKEILQDIIRAEITTISYPFGRSSTRVREIARECGYRYGYSMRYPTATDDSNCLGRIPVYGFDTFLTIRAKLSGSGLLYQLERTKGVVTNTLSGGTVFLNSLRRFS